MDIGSSEGITPPSTDIGAVERIEPKRGMQGFGKQEERRHQGAHGELPSDEEDARPADEVEVSAEYRASHDAPAAAPGSPPAVPGQTNRQLDLEA